MKQNVNSLASELARLETLDRAALATEWVKLNKTPPVANLSRGLMLRALAYQLQEATYGGLKKSVREQLSRIASSTNSTIQPAIVQTGTRLLREWHGVTHEVMIEEDGVQYRGQRYGSLSEVAFVITGTKWSGPAFFGLKNRKAGKTSP